MILKDMKKYSLQLMGHQRWVNQVLQMNSFPHNSHRLTLDLSCGNSDFGFRKCQSE